MRHWRHAHQSPLHYGCGRGFAHLKRAHTLVIALGDGVQDGGFGENITHYYGASDMRVLNYGMKKEFIGRCDVGKQLLKNRLTAPQIVEDIQSVINR